MHVNNFLLLYFGKSLVHRLPSIEHQSILVQDHFNVQSKKDSASITNKPTLTLRKTCSYSAFFWSLFSRYWPEKLRNGHFPRSVILMIVTSRSLWKTARTVRNLLKPRHKNFHFINSAPKNNFGCNVKKASQNFVIAIIYCFLKINDLVYFLEMLFLTKSCWCRQFITKYFIKQNFRTPEKPK